MICKDREDPSLTDDIRLDLVITTLEGEILQQSFPPTGLLTFGLGILCSGACAVLCRMCGCIPGRHPPDASSTPYLQLWQPRYLLMLSHVLRGAKSHSPHTHFSTPCWEPLSLSINFKAINKEQSLEKNEGENYSKFCYDWVKFCINYSFKNMKINLW